jgi:enoyl-CoA hydratase
VIARLNGHVRAGGLGLVGAADIAVAGPAATFAFTEVRLGLTPAMISITTAPRMRPRDAARYYLTGETFGPQQALDSGLITVIGEDVDEALAPILTALAACSPQGLAETKQLLSRNLLVDFDDDAALMQQWSARLFASEEAREGMQAFLERRPPRWVAP